MEMNHDEIPDFFPSLSRRVIELVSRAREALFHLDVPLAMRLMAECSSVTAESRKAEAACNASLLVGISSAEERLHLVRCAQRCSRLGRVAHQVMQMMQNIQELDGQVTEDEMVAFRPLFLLAEVELRDAVLSILRDDEQLAYGVRRKDEELDSLYAAEMKRIFHHTSTAMFYNFQTGMSLLFILRAIERIGDHAAQLAVPSFYLLREGSGRRQEGCGVLREGSGRLQEGSGAPQAQSHASDEKRAANRVLL